MDIDPHMLQQILQRIYQQMRCPQCNKQIPVDFSAVRMVSPENMVLHLNCDDCSAHIVLHAAMQGVEHLTVKTESTDLTKNASSELQTTDYDLTALRDSLSKAGGSFAGLFGEAPSEDAPAKS